MSRLVWIVLIGGFLPGVLISLSIVSRTPSSFLDLTFTTLLSIAIIGGALAFVSHVFTTHVRRTITTTGALFVTVLVVSVIAAAAAYAAADSLPHGRWQPVAAAPEELEMLAGPDCLDLGQAVIYARARSGRFYQLSDESTTTWQLTDRIPSEGSSRLGQCHYGQEPESWLKRSPSPPHDAVSSHRITLVGVDCGADNRYVLVRDGTIWRWSWYSCIIGESAFLTMITGAILISALGVAIYLLLRKPPIGWARSMSSPR